MNGIETNRHSIMLCLDIELKRINMFQSKPRRIGMDIFNCSKNLIFILMDMIPLDNTSRIMMTIWLSTGKHTMKVYRQRYATSVRYM